MYSLNQAFPFTIAPIAPPTAITMTTPMVLISSTKAVKLATANPIIPRSRVPNINNNIPIIMAPIAPASAPLVAPFIASSFTM